MDLAPPPAQRSTTLRTAAACTAALAIALALAACSSSSPSTRTAATDSSTTASTTAPTSTTSAAAADVEVGQTKLGKVLVDEKGRTLYLLTKDTPTTSTCTGTCAQGWPPLTVTGTPTAGSDVTGNLTIIRRADGTTQVVVNGHPLYTFAGDGKPGDTSGQGVGHVWYAVTPQGTAAADES
ncbi:MAG TPA: hypothetical protein VMT43_05430 [Acidimicrobiales bacterium]|nr:hypothetical protein [Acidimicrobiales bacterium]